MEMHLKNKIAIMARQLCSETIPMSQIQSKLYWTVSPLSKNLGVRPICIGKVLRQIFSRSIVSVRNGIVTSSGNLQLCGGQRSGCEIAIHAAVDLYRVKS